MFPRTFQRSVPSTAVDDDISAADTMQEDQVNAVVVELTNARSAPNHSVVYGFWDQAHRLDNREA
jgi:hypothetical protein